MTRRALLLCVLPGLLDARSALAGDPLVLKRTLRLAEARDGHPAGDHDGDGVADLMVKGADSIDVVSGLNGRKLATYTGSSGSQQSFGWAREIAGDVDADGIADLLVSAPFQSVDGKEFQGRVYAIPGGTPSGEVGSLPLLYEIGCPFDRCELGLSLASTSELVIASASSSVTLADGKTGEIRAVVTGVFAGVAALGDLDGDGVEDVVIGGPTGFLVNGALRAQAVLDVSSSTFLDHLLGKVDPPQGIGAAPGNGDHEQFVTLGDPDETNGLRESLIACVTGSNGIIAYVLSSTQPGSISAREVASSLSQPGVVPLGFDLARVGDCDGDGVDDLAILDDEFMDGGRLLGRVFLLSGRGLLDGLSGGDILQEIRGQPFLPFYGSLRALGDHDGDGLEEVMVTGLDERLGTAFIDIYAVIRAGGNPPDCNQNGIPDFADLKPGVIELQGSRNSSVGRGPRAVTALDLEGDGLPDLVTANLLDHTVSVLLDTEGHFGPSQPFPVANGPSAVVGADLDGDGDQDLATADHGTVIPGVGLEHGDTVSILENDGAGSFAGARTLPVAAGPLDLAAADLDDDGDPDLAVVSLGEGAVQVFLNHGTGGLLESWSEPLAFGTSIVAAELDGDGILDLAVATRSDSLRLFQGEGFGRFHALPAMPLEFTPMAVVAADLDGDGALDLATANSRLYGVTVILNQAEGQWRPLERYQFGNASPESLASADMDLDGDPDLITGNSGSLEGVWVAINDGWGGFHEVKRQMLDGQVTAVNALDLDADGDADVAATNALYHEVSVFRNVTPPPTSRDCNRNGKADECDIASGESADCDENGVPDACDVLLGADRDGNEIPDACERQFFHRGDANGDEMLDISDPLFTLDFLFVRPTEIPCAEAADYDNDGRIVISDPIAALLYLFEAGFPPASPGSPAAPCGADPDVAGSPRDLGCSSYAVCGNP